MRHSWKGADILEASGAVMSQVEQCRVVVVFGPNDGLVRAVRTQIGVMLESKPTVLSMGEVNKTPSLLWRHAKSLSLFDNPETPQRRVIVVSDATDTLTPILQKHLQAELATASMSSMSSMSSKMETSSRSGGHDSGGNGNDHDAVIVACMAGHLGRSSRLVRWAESVAHAGVVACYDDDPEVVIRLLRRGLKKENVHLSDRELEDLAALIAGDRGIVTSEIAKIEAYVAAMRASGTEVTFQDLKGLIADTAEASLAQLIDACCTGDLLGFIAHQNMIGASVNPISALRGLELHLAEIDRTQLRLRGGATLHEALSQLRRPLFFRRRELFQQACHSMSRDVIQNALQGAINLEISIKRGEIADDVLMTQRLFMQLVYRTAQRHRGARFRSESKPRSSY